MDVPQGLGDRFEKQVVHHFLILTEHKVQFARHGKHDMEIPDIQQIALLVFNPLFFGHCLAFRAMPVPAGVV